jgi:SWIM/SEC-C metal-binding protein
MPKLGSAKRPVVVRVRSEELGEEIVALCNKHGWQVIVGIEPDTPEDISDVEQLLREAEKPKQVIPRPAPKVSPNDYCPCGSGKKFKKCRGVS